MHDTSPKWSARSPSRCSSRPAAVPVARLRAGRRHRAAAAREVRRPGGVHPPGGLHGQRPEQGPAQAAAAVRAPDGAVAVRRRQATARSPRGSKARSASTRSSRRSRPRCEAPRRLAVLRGAAPLGVARARGARARPAHEPADPGVAVRLGGRDRARRSFAALAVLWPTPRLQEPGWRSSLGGSARFLGSTRGGSGCAGPSASGCSSSSVLAGYLGEDFCALQPRADVHPDHLLRSFCPNSSEVQSGAVGLAPPARNTSRRGTSRHQRFSYSGIKRTSMGSLKTTANLKASGKLGS